MISKRHNREEFQGKMLLESGPQSRVLSDILYEVRRLGACAQSVKSASESRLMNSISSLPTPLEQDTKGGGGTGRIDEKEKSDVTTTVKVEHPKTCMYIYESWQDTLKPQQIQSTTIPYTSSTHPQSSLHRPLPNPQLNTIQTQRPLHKHDSATP